MPATKASTGKPTGSSASRTVRARRDRGLVDGLTSLAEQLTNRIIKPLGLVLLTRERIQDTLEDAVRRGRMTRTDANHLATELMRRGREQTDELLADIDRLLGRGRERSGEAKGSSLG